MNSSPVEILLIEDNEDDYLIVRDLISEISSASMQVEWVDTFEAAYSALRQGQHDVCLLDYHLGGYTGLELLQHLPTESRIPTILLTGNEDYEVDVAAAKAGAADYLVKGSINTSLLERSIRYALERKTSEAALLQAQRFAQATVDALPDNIAVLDEHGVITAVNAAWRTFAHINGFIGASAGVGANYLCICDNSDVQEARAIAAAIRTVMAGKQELFCLEYPCHTAEEERWFEMRVTRFSGSGPLHVVIAHENITPRKVAEGRLLSSEVKMAHLAQHDFLTGLPNRVLLNDRIAQAIALAQRRNTSLAVLFVDLDNFKHINDSLGHAVGDKLLQSVGQRLRACVRNSDTVSRQGGDEFVLLVSEDKHAENASLTADKILTALTVPMLIDGHELHVTPSVGISIYPTDAQDADTLIKNADTAMYYAKQKGRNNYQFFKSEMNARAVERQAIETHLRHALERQEFVLHYQPKIDLETGMITGVEALLRWIHPEWGMVMPDRFVEVAEHCGLIVPIGRWVLREACTQAKRWENAGLKPGSVAVNISALEFRHQDFVQGVCDILHETELSPDCLQLDITESALMRNANSSSAILQQLKSLGIHLAVDNFGTGYSSLRYLNQFPIDVLKIDPSFVHDIDAAQGNGILVSAVIAMGISLHQRVVAEGVEEQSQVSFLRAQHCVEAQGYIFSRPLVAEQLAALLATGISQMIGNSGNLSNFQNL
ncbi:MAG TPA: EAL domain-containing protein [Abditibacteriaceae bacterium]|jgi:diguanylate cyclase (GGDEF)-like protein